MVLKCGLISARKFQLVVMEAFRQNSEVVCQFWAQKDEHFLCSEMHLQDISAFGSKHFNIICSLQLPIFFVLQGNNICTRLRVSCIRVGFRACFAQCEHFYSSSKKQFQLFRQYQSRLGRVRKILNFIGVDSTVTGLLGKIRTGKNMAQRGIPEDL